MKTLTALFIVFLAGIFTLNLFAAEEQTKVNSFAQINSLFPNPPVQFRSAPLWVWNDAMSKEKIDIMLEDMKSQGIGGAFIHPRPGLITPYLSDEWFDLVRYTVDRGEQLGMHIWLYDENSYPSGFAGGHVPAQMPESYNQGQGLRLTRAKKLPKDVAEKCEIVLKRVGSEFIDITARLADEKGQSGDYYLFTKSYFRKTPWHGGFSYVDLLYDGVTEKFIELTMTKGYERAIGDEFGKVVPGIFTDEPNIHPPGGITWTPSLFTAFQKRWGYDLKTHLPSLFAEVGDWKRVRHNYYALLLQMFIDKWSKPWYEYTETHNLIWTGHYWEHGWPSPAHGPDNMAMYAWHQMPGIDILMNNYSEDVHAQFGNVRAVKELISVANQMGRSRTLSETYGAGGWDLRFGDMKRIGDWEYVLGVNFLNQHLTYTTLKGARKQDHPQSFSYHEPWWKFYHVLGDYFGRLSLALSAGEQVNHILVLEPTTTAWLYYSPEQASEKYSKLGPTFQNFILALEKRQLEYDLGSENIIKDHGTVNKDRLVVGERAYDLLVLPPGLENLDSKTAALVKKYVQAGGKVLSFVDAPPYVDGVESSAVQSLPAQFPKQWIRAAALEDARALSLLRPQGIRFHQPEKIEGKLFHHRRTLQDGELVFLANTDAEEWSFGSFTVRGASVRELDLVSGEVKPYPCSGKGDSVQVDFDLPPFGSLLLYVSPTGKPTPTNTESASITILPSDGKIKIERIAPNTLTLDYCDLKIGDVEEKDIYYFQACQTVFKHYGFEGDPWSQAVQYKSTILDKNNFPKDSGFIATYWFDVAPGVDESSLQVVVERPELWQVYINDRLVQPRPGEYWLDRDFAVYDIGAYVDAGANRITLHASPMTVHSELAPIYLLGDFALQSQEKGWMLIPARPVALGSWKDNGMPFYSDGVSYTRTLVADAGKRYIVKLTGWCGSVAEVKVNGKEAGIIAWAPYELDVTDYLESGGNKISVIVYGTLKNLLGPHHIGAIRGSAWPSSFQSAPPHQPSGMQYDFIDYGLFKEFTLIEASGPRQRVYWKNYRASKPVIHAEDSIILDSSTAITLSTKDKDAEIRYTLDGTPPTEASPLYTQPIVLRQSAVVSARTFKKGMEPSSIESRSFYLLDSQKNGIHYAYYEGQWERLPKFESLQPIREGKIYRISLDRVQRRKENFALKLNGRLKIDKAGQYTFFLTSNDGSKLLIDDVLVVDHDGLHGAEERVGRIQLQPGLHSIEVLYFDGGGSQALSLSWQGPGFKRQLLPPDRLFY